MRISVDVRFDGITSALRDLERNQAPFAIASALTATAKDVQAAEVEEIKKVIDRPTPFTLNSIYVLPANKRKFQATVGIKDATGGNTPPNKYLQAQVEGGTRRNKRFELALRAAGVLPAGYSIVPGDAAKMDGYGNIDRKFIEQLLAYFKAFPEMGYKPNMTDRRRAALAKGSAKRGVQGVVYFVGRPGNGRLPLGIWARYSLGHGSAIKPVLMFVQETRYERRFDFFRVAERTIQQKFRGNLRAAWQRAWATAR